MNSFYRQLRCGEPALSVQGRQQALPLDAGRHRVPESRGKYVLYRLAAAPLPQQQGGGRGVRAEGHLQGRGCAAAGQSVAPEEPVLQSLLTAAGSQVQVAYPLRQKLGRPVDRQARPRSGEADGGAAG